LPETSVSRFGSQCAIKHTILSIQSEVVRGHVGNSAARFALQRCGSDVFCLPTVLLSNHPGHGRTAGEATDAAKLSSLLDGLKVHGWLKAVDGVLTGYLGDPAQAGVAAHAVREVKAANPKAIFLCDPVFGDDDGAYARLGVAEAMARDLIPLADIAAPNRFELSSLTSQRIDNPADAVRAARLLGVPEVIVTSVPHGGSIANVAVSALGAWVCSVARSEGVPHGTGDLLAALYLHFRLSGEEVPLALASTISRVQSLIAQSLGCDELALVVSQHELVTPSISVTIARLA
jgi:pyridoxine kinase